MKLLNLLEDYRCAIKVATDAKSGNWPAGALSVFRARVLHDIGPRYHSLYDLARIPENEWPEYIIDNGLKHKLRKINNKDAREVVVDKFAFLKHCEKHNLPTIPILATIDRQSPSDPLNGLHPQRWQDLLLDAPDQLFIKLIDGTWGIDAFIANRIADNQWEFCDQHGSLADLHAFAMNRLRDRRGWIIQPVLRNHSGLRSIMSPTALGTIRAVTYLRRSEVELLYAVLRIPVGDNRADNFAHGSTGNLAAPIDLSSGRVGTPRASKTKFWPDMINVPEHPDTRAQIKGAVLPHWPEVAQLVRNAQLTLPNLPTLGWDIAITDAGPIIVEANSTYDVDIVQVAYGRGLKTEFLETRLNRDYASLVP